MHCASPSKMCTWACFRLRVGILRNWSEVSARSPREVLLWLVYDDVMKPWHWNLTPSGEEKGREASESCVRCWTGRGGRRVQGSSVRWLLPSEAVAWDKQTTGHPSPVRQDCSWWDDIKTVSSPLTDLPVLPDPVGNRRGYAILKWWRPLGSVTSLSRITDKSLFSTF